MKKLVLVLLALLLFVVPLSVAQEDEVLPACTAEEFAAFTVALGESLAEFGSFLLPPEEPTAANLTEWVVLIDAFNYGYWEGYYEAELGCAEASWLGLVMGLLLDETLITSQLEVLAQYEMEAGNTDIADELLELAAEREIALDANEETLGQIIIGVMSGSTELNFELPICEDEDLEATYDGLEEIGTAYEVLGMLAEVAEDDDVSILVAAYAELSSAYWVEFVPIVPMCYEAQDEAVTVGLILDESLIVVSNYRLAQLSAEAGEDETAEVLLESAMIRFEDLNAVIEYYYGEEE